MGVPKRNKAKKSKGTVGFEDELITREDAKAILQQFSTKDLDVRDSTNLTDNNSIHKKTKKKRNIENGADESSDLHNNSNNIPLENGVKESISFNKKKIKNKKSKVDGDASNGQKIDNKPPKNKKRKENDILPIPIKKKKKNVSEDNQNQHVSENEVAAETEDSQDEGQTTKTEQKESIRAKKRQRHAELLKQKKLKAVLKMQQSALNYLSMWKHSRSDWKFEKLKQIWLQQNLYDSAKIPSEFWDITVNYFAGAKGALRDKILKEALEIIEKEESSTVENSDEDHQTKVQRARDIIQNLQE